MKIAVHIDKIITLALLASLAGIFAYAPAPVKALSPHVTSVQTVVVAQPQLTPRIAQTTTEKCEFATQTSSTLVQDQALFNLNQTVGCLSLSVKPLFVQYSLQGVLESSSPTVRVAILPPQSAMREHIRPVSRSGLNVSAPMPIFRIEAGTMSTGVFAALLLVGVAAVISRKKPALAMLKVRRC